MRIVRAAEHRAMPWKNGGGTTVEIAAFPEGAGLDDFDWRLSMATVASDGPFSVFPGVDRTLAVLDGEGIELSIAGRPPLTLTPGSEPLAFPGDVPAAAQLVGGPIRDLNIMTRRGRCRHAMRPLRLAERPERLAVEETALLFCAEGSIALRDGPADPVVLAPHDSAILPAGSVSARAEAGSRALALLVELARDG